MAKAQTEIHKLPKRAREAVQALEEAKKAQEDAEDWELIREAGAEGGEPVPWEEIKRKHGL